LPKIGKNLPKIANNLVSSLENRKKSINISEIWRETGILAQKAQKTAKKTAPRPPMRLGAARGWFSLKNRYIGAIMAVCCRFIVMNPTTFRRRKIFHTVEKSTSRTQAHGGQGSMAS
jgi:hypothetical protein